ncbi:ATP-binding protein [Phaeacidiphilus oryzae]|jgi:anti-sigma regulatory factor (Ser/Thr protein kinase)|uniref:ATP-binding protein n=1 Tax=Phaeacidiphilus oryzae TaxID=348818 RepID=UPI00056D95E1|nr:ATP-binding protein [Phaeacidiphilus oryzae]
MATVELRFTALGEHVRTARLVAAAVARRAGVDDSVLDEVRVAVGEACARAVRLHQRTSTDAPVQVRLEEQEKRFLIEVVDGVHGDSESGGTAERSAVAGGDDLDEDPTAEDTMGLAVLSGLVDDLDVSSGAEGGVIRMSWPVEDGQASASG